MQALADAEQAREQLQAALTEAAAARHDAARHRDAAGQAREECAAAEPRLERLRREADWREADVQRLIKRMEELQAGQHEQACFIVRRAIPSTCLYQFEENLQTLAMGDNLMHMLSYEANRPSRLQVDNLPQCGTGHFH